MAAQQQQHDVEAIPLNAVRDNDDMDKDDFPLLSGRSSTDAPRPRAPGARSQPPLAQRRLVRFLHICFLVSALLGVAGCAAVISREFLEFLSFDDKDRGWGANAGSLYPHRDWPIMGVMLFGIAFAALNISRLKTQHRPLPTLLNVVILIVLLLISASAGFGMVPWENKGDLLHCDPSQMPKDERWRQYYKIVCGNLRTYHLVRRLDMICVDLHALVNLNLLVLNAVYHYREKRSIGEGMLTSEIATAKQYGRIATKLLVMLVQWCSQTGRDMSQRGARSVRDYRAARS